jgi:tRNA-specific 2-thiouridylase
MIKKPTSAVVALSGGVDSALSAALLKRGGWAIHGLHFLIPASPETIESRAERVEMIADGLGIPLKTLDLREGFKRQIIDPFKDKYLQGQTPNPCVMCNELIKFECLLQYAQEHGIDSLVTGHYVRIRKRDENSLVELLRGKERGKEQSYFLHRLGQTVLSRAVFPLGEMGKSEVREAARKIGLPVHSTPESQEICFLPGQDYRHFIESEKRRGTVRKGHIINDDGEILAEHGGSYRYTIGQRKGLGIASSHPYYVKEIRPDTNEVVVGRREDLYSRRVQAECFAWVCGEPSQKVIKAHAQVRYRHRAAPGRLEVLSKDRVDFIFDEPQWAIAPGQALVCYEGEKVLGGGWIM